MVKYFIKVTNVGPNEMDAGTFAGALEKIKEFVTTSSETALIIDTSLLEISVIEIQSDVEPQ